MRIKVNMCVFPNFSAISLKCRLTPFLQSQEKIREEKEWRNNWVPIIYSKALFYLIPMTTLKLDVTYPHFIYEKTEAQKS